RISRLHDTAPTIPIIWWQWGRRTDTDSLREALGVDIEEKLSKASDESDKSQSAWAPPAARALDEAVRKGGVTKGRARDRRSSTARIKAAKWASIAGLLP